MDLDDDELKATRRMNGSDKNVGSIEEDIKILKEEIKRVNKINDLSGIYVPINILEHLIKAYKELKQENRKLSKANETYIKSIQNITPVLMNDYIEKSLVKEKIEELDREYRKILCKEGMSADKFDKLNKLEVETEVLQELLEKRK